MSNEKKASAKGCTVLKVFIISLALILAGGILANIVHTSAGSVKIHDITYVTLDGAELRALLYIPNSATPSNPAPVVVSSHGYNNTAEVQDLNCIELSKRGFIVMAIDAYGHGGSNLPDGRISLTVDDMGGYSALQYIGTLPYADKSRVGMVGHSMGCAVIQNSALRAWTNYAKDPGTVVPSALLLTSNSFVLDADGNAVVNNWPINAGVVYGQYDEWAEGMWGTPKGSDLNTTKNAKAGIGFNNFDYNTYYTYGQQAPMDRSQAINAARSGKLRIVYQPAIDHPLVHFNGEAVGDVVDYFDITLANGQGKIPASQQSWFGKQLGTAISLLAFFVFITSFGLLLLKTNYFSSIIQSEPQGITTVTDTKTRIRYWIIFIIGLLPAPLLAHWAIGYPIDIAATGRAVPIVMPASKVFPMPCVNGIFVLNWLTGIISLVIYFITFKAFAQKAGCSFENLGLKQSGRGIFRSAVLAICVLAAGYFMLVLCDYFFKTDFRLFVLSIKTITPAKWAIYLRYLPSFLFFFLISAMCQNTFTRINNQKEWVNYILIILASFGGLLVLHTIDYTALISTGIKAFPYIPGTKYTSALAGLFVWNLMFILPIAAVISRIFFRKTGSIWVGGFINALIITLFSISNTVIAAQVF